MAWETVNLNDINPEPDMIPVGAYTFQIMPGTKIDKYGALSVRVAIASEGDFQGRQLFLSYPDPERPNCKWAEKAVKMLQIALGVDCIPGETPVEYFGRVANFRFTADVKHRTYTKSDGSENTKAEVQLYSVRPAA